ncbi:MAG: iron ABC transporter permease [Treponema sp.]|jgi:iron complex transport system permease protein|nr:iron ABC transporter permease [Treponema sp.]
MTIKNSIRVSIGVLVSFIIAGAAASLGTSGIGFGDTVQIVTGKILRLPLAIDPKSVSIVWMLRLPRVLLAFFAGGCFAMSGAVTQSVLRNPLASPYILGVSSGASLGAGLVIISGISLPFLRGFTLPVAGFSFGLITVFLVVFFSSRVDKSMSSNTIILCGMVFSQFVGALLTTISAIFSNDLKRIVMWQMGSFALKGWSYVRMILPFLVIGAVGILRYTREMDILTFGDDEAKSAGVEAESIRKQLLVFATIITGAAVSLSGVIGFVDLIAPHVARKLVGSQHKYVVPMSFIIGGCLLVITDLAARTVISPSELPVGAITALIGAPFFAWVYFKRRRTAL